MISKINLLCKAVSEKLDGTPIRDTVRNPAAQMNFTSTNDTTREELRGKGIKSPSKLLSSKYLSQSSLAEQSRNLSSLKCVHFVNSIVILNKEDEAKEQGNVKTSTTKYEDHEMTVKSEEEFEEETKEEIKEEEKDSPKHFDTFPTMKELKYHEWLSKNTQPPWSHSKLDSHEGQEKQRRRHVRTYDYESSYKTDKVTDSPFRGVLDDQRTQDDSWFVLKEKVKRGDLTRKENFIKMKRERKIN
nr:hypothetical protein [Tanacetum cinerariifolium]